MNAITTFKPTTRFAGISLLLAAALGSSFGLATAQAADTKESGSGMAGMAESAGEYWDDSSITAKVKWAIMRDPVLETLEISVVTTDGVVSLTGAVDSQQSIDRATAVAREFPAVKSVENHLTVTGAK
jgi:hyperosmotically inducible protein